MVFVIDSFLDFHSAKANNKSIFLPLITVENHKRNYINDVFVLEGDCESSV